MKGRERKLSWGHNLDNIKSLRFLLSVSPRQSPLHLLTLTFDLALTQKLEELRVS